MLTPIETIEKKKKKKIILREILVFIKGIFAHYICYTLQNCFLLL